MTNITTFNMNTLVSMVNALGGTATAKTFSQRSKAVERITKLATEKQVDLSTFFDATGNVVPVPAKKAKKVKEAKPAGEKKVSIRSVAEALLLKVVSTDTDGRATGLSYDDVLAAVKEQFPTAKTTVGCLRWYAVRMREANQTVPNRPRAVTVKSAAVAAPQGTV